VGPSRPSPAGGSGRDRLLPRGFSAVSHRFGVPVRTSLITGVVVAAVATFVPLTDLAELVNIGTLFAFVVVCAAVLIMRRTHPEAERPFRCPLVPLVPILGIAFCLLLMFSLPAENWLRLIIWLLLGFIVYFGYGRHHSIMARRRAREEREGRIAAAES
ncbi:MAG TPA: amino acid permease, partial [Candidatus Binatia bacterium]|nr:amino acid permease [Candidatus Binatia bacterium]